MPADSWCPLCGADRAIVAWCPRCANALGIIPPHTQDQDQDEDQRQHSGRPPTPREGGASEASLQSHPHKPPPKNISAKNLRKKSGAEKLASAALRRDRMREYMRRRRHQAKALKAAAGVDPNIVHPNLVDANPSPEEIE
jgi:hypothetical protein